MKKTVILFLIISLFLIASGCEDNKNIYLPEAENDKIYTTVGISDDLHQGEGYSITIPLKDYRYDKDYDDGNTEEKWEYTKKDDVEIKVTTYKNSDEITARRKFLKDNEDYIFEDLMGYSLCGIEPDGDVLWFNLYESNRAVYIVSWEYPKNTKEDLKAELASIVKSFKLAE